MASALLLLITTILISSLFLFFFFFNISKKKDKKKAHHPPLPPCPKGWPILGNLPQLGSKPHKTLHALSKTYGPLIRLRMGSVTIVVASSADVASQFLRTLDANFSNRPPNCAAEHIAYNYQSLVFSPYGPRWRMLRRLFTVHLFSPKVLDDLRYVREEEVALLASKFRRAQGVAIEVGKLVNICVTNALTRVAMGRRLFEEEKEGPDDEEFKKMVVELMQLSAAFNVEDFIPWLKALDVRGAMRKMKRVHRWYDEIFNKILEQRKMELERGGGGGDFLSLLLGFKRDANGDEETKLTDIEIKALLMDLFTAGTDSTSSTVEWALAELLRRPDILAAAQKELDSVVGKSRLVSELDFTNNNVPLLHAIVKETFRLHPPGPLSVPRISSEPCEVSGFHIPEGSTLLVNIWSISRDPEVWDSPLEFDPARFLPGGKHVDVDLKGVDFELIPFGSGRRICAGMRLGLRMVTLMVASLVHGFDWVLPDGQTPETLDMEEDFGLTIERTVPLVARPTPRLDREAYLV